MKYKPTDDRLLDLNRKFHVAVRADDEIDVIIFSKKDDANKFCKAHPEYSVYSSSVYNLQEALDIFGEDESKFETSFYS